MIRLLHLAKLTPAAEILLSGVGDANDWQEIKNEIVQGNAQLFLAPENTYLVLQVDRGALIVLAIVGKNGRAIMQTLIATAYRMQLDFVWYRTKRKGMQRLLKQFSPKQFENGYRINLQ